MLPADRPADLLTPRLRLVVLLDAEIEALIAGDAVRASELAHLTFPPGWPEHADARDGLRIHLKHLRADPAELPWRVRVVAEREGHLVVGAISLKGPPGPNGEVEIGWGISSDRRRRGYAAEAARAVIDWAQRQPGVCAVCAAIADDNSTSQRLAVRLGFERTARIRRTLPLWIRANT